jgi:hypothetical protein
LEVALVMQVCPRCHRSNPGEAAFCYFDGVDLRAIATTNGQARPEALPRSISFPSGRHCGTLSELATACLEEWDAACEMLSGGRLAQFLIDIGRSDLARAAQPGGLVKGDDALDAFLQALPGAANVRPRLDVVPRRLQMGTLSVGDEKRVRVQIQNTGKGLLHGTITVAQGAEWLRLDGGKDDVGLRIRTATSQTVTVIVSTRGLSSPHKYSGKLTLVTNGGVAELPVRLDLGLHAFPKPPFLDVTTPRELADRMRTQPKQAVPLLESGEIANWFVQNGWTFPVQGKPAQGIAAVQQFFEAMGLSKAPILQLEGSVIELHCFINQKVPGQFLLRTDSKKWVFAHATTAANWIHLSTEDVSGPQQAVVSFEVDSADLAPGQTHEANIKLIGNSGQTFTGRVRLTVEGDAVPPPAPKRPVSPWVVGAAAAGLTRLALAVPADIGARYLLGGGPDQTARSPVYWGVYPLEQAAFVRDFVWVAWWIGPLLGAIYMLRKGDGLHDMLRGILAGAAAGLAGSASLACLMPILDAIPSWLWQALAPRLGFLRLDGHNPVWLFLWVLEATLVWSLLGMLLAAGLGRAGGRASQVLFAVSRWLSHAFRWLGFRDVAARFVIR